MSPGPTPKESPDRCALRAYVRGDPMLGTAFPAGRVLLVEQPGPWGPDGLVESDFDHRVAHALRDRATSEGIRLQVIRRPGRHPTSAERRWGLADCRFGREALRWGTFARDADLLDLPLDGSAGVPDDAPAFLVCTHGRHDPCCALRGRPTVAALAALRPGQVWETTHVGGDRFAANVLVLPTGYLYGRVGADGVTALVAAAEADDIHLPNLRGRVGLEPAVQAALAFGFEHLGVRRGLRPRSAVRGADGRTTVHLDTPDGELLIAVRTEKLPAVGLTCANPRPGWFLAYRASLEL
jgi:hypothetical protein